jgi:hypothetical protein
MTGVYINKHIKICFANKMDGRGLTLPLYPKLYRKTANFLNQYVEFQYFLTKHYFFTFKGFQ